MNTLDLIIAKYPPFETYANMFKKKRGRPKKTFPFVLESGQTVNLTKRDIKILKATP